MRHLVPAAAAAAAALALTACGSSSAGPGNPAPSTSSAAAARAPRPAAQPVTAAAARKAAVKYFDLYAARLYGATWSLLTPAAKRAVSRADWAKIHDQCIAPRSGLAYKVSRPTVAGHAAVVNVSLAGALASIGSEEQTFRYSKGKWRYVPPDLAVYKGHTAAQALASLTAQGTCSR